MEHFRFWHGRGRDGGAGSGEDSDVELVASDSGFAEYEIGSLVAYLEQRNTAFGYPLRAYDGRWLALGGASFADFAGALEETREQLSRAGDEGFNDTIFGVLGLGFWPNANARHGLPALAGNRWQILDGRLFHTYADAEYETWRLCPALFDRALSSAERSARINAFLVGLPEYRRFLVHLLEQLRCSGGAVASVHTLVARLPEPRLAGFSGFQ